MAYPYVDNKNWRCLIEWRPLQVQIKICFENFCQVRYFRNISFYEDEEDDTAI